MTTHTPKRQPFFEAIQEEPSRSQLAQSVRRLLNGTATIAERTEAQQLIMEYDGQRDWLPEEYLPHLYRAVLEAFGAVQGGNTWAVTRRRGWRRVVEVYTFRLGREDRGVDAICDCPGERHYHRVVHRVAADRFSSFVRWVREVLEQ